MFQAILLVIGFIICNIVGRAILRMMGVIMIDSLAGIIFKPAIYGFIAIMIVLGIIVLLFKGIFYILWYLLLLCIKLIPVAIIICLIIFIIKSLKNRK
jgi:hypothetical protein